MLTRTSMCAAAVTATAFVGCAAILSVSPPASGVHGESGGATACKQALIAYGKASVQALTDGASPWGGAEEAAGVSYLAMGCRDGGLLAAMHAVAIARVEIAARWATSHDGPSGAGR